MDDTVRSRSTERSRFGHRANDGAGSALGAGSEQRSHGRTPTHTNEGTVYLASVDDRSLFRMVAVDELPPIHGFTRRCSASDQHSTYLKRAETRKRRRSWPWTSDDTRTVEQVAQDKWASDIREGVVKPCELHRLSKVQFQAAVDAVAHWIDTDNDPRTNANVTDPEVRALASSFMLEPIVWSKENHNLDNGQARLCQALSLGITRLPAIVMDDLSGAR